MPKISLKNTLSNTCFSQTTGPYYSFVDEKKNWIAIANSYYTQWSARNIPMRSNSLLFYNMDSLELIGCIERLEFHVNEVCSHPELGIVAVATGQYDGGAYFEGKLLLWDAVTGDLHSVFTDNREVKRCAFIDNGNKLRFVISPTGDLDGQPYTETTYEIGYPCATGISLDQIEPVSIVHTDVLGEGEDHKTVRDIAEHKLASLATKADRYYASKRMAWDILFLDDYRIAVARNQSTIEIWDTQTLEVKEIRLPDAGDCVQLFLNAANQTLLVNCWVHDHWRSQHNIFYAIDLSSFTVDEIIRCNHFLSRSSENYFLARQTDYVDRTKEDFILDCNYNIVYINRLGHYDLFNHYLRIDDCESLYFLQGDPSEGHENKIVCSINPTTGKIKKLWQIEKKPDLFNEISGVLFKNTLILSGKRFRGLSDFSELFAIDLVTEKEVWHVTLPGKTSCLAKMEELNIVIIALTNGEILLVDLGKGQTIETLTPVHNFTFERPLSLAVRGTQLGVGLTNGEICIYEIQGY